MNVPDVLFVNAFDEVNLQMKLIWFSNLLFYYEWSARFFILTAMYFNFAWRV